LKTKLKLIYTDEEGIKTFQSEDGKIVKWIPFRAIKTICFNPLTGEERAPTEEEKHSDGGLYIEIQPKLNER